MPPVHPRAIDDPDGPEAVPGRAGTTASEVADGRRTRRSGVAEEVPFESGSEHDGHKSKRCASVLEGANADVLVLGQRTAEAGAILRSLVAAASSLHSGAGTDADGEGKRHGSEPVLQHRGALLEVPRHGRSEP